MGGKVSVYSKVGVGTKFVITLSLNAYDKAI
jgi:signal transduction histidine kinase